MGKGRKPNSIKASGDELAEPVFSFTKIYDKFGISQHLQESIRNSKYKAPTAVQAQVIPLMLENREIVCSAATGSGKTLAFLLPIIHQLKEPKSIGSFRAVILAPTRELAKQIHREALRLSFKTNLKIHHLKDVNEASKKFNPESTLKFDILVTTPNKLAYLLNTEPPSIKLDKLEWLVFDECDRLFELGFKDDLTAIHKFSLESDKCKRAMFSATFDKQLEEWAKIQIENVAIVVIGGKNRTAPTVKQSLVYVGNEDGKRFALREIINTGLDVPALIFVDRKEKAKQLASEFMYDEINIDYIDSERTPQERDLVVKRFREGLIWVLVCTDLLCRGIDFMGVNLVINFDCPKTFVSYVHRVGRTGRAGRKGSAITFVADEDLKLIRPIIGTMRRSGQEINQKIVELMNRKRNNKKHDKKGKQNSKSEQHLKKGGKFFDKKKKKTNKENRFDKKTRTIKTNA